MATTNSAGAAGTGRFAENWRQMLGFGSLFIAVISVVILGAVLRTDAGGGGLEPLQPNRTPPETAATPPAVEPPRRVIEQPAQQAVEPPPAQPRAVRTEPREAKPRPVEDLARRASNDIDRLAGSGHAWTAQLAMLCDSAGARELVARHGDRSKLYLLPALHRDSACFRVCWGHYADREAAKRAEDLPSSLRTLQPDPLPKAFYEVLE